MTDVDDLAAEFGIADRTCPCGAALPGSSPRHRKLCNGCRRTRRRSGREAPRSQTLSVNSITRAKLRELALLFSVDDLLATNDRPRTRAECVDGPRPCPFVGCKYALYLDVNPETGSLKLNHPHLEPWDLAESCALDLADRGGITLELTGEVMNIQRERVRQIEVRALHTLKAASADLADDAELTAADRAA